MTAFLFSEPVMYVSLLSYLGYYVNCDNITTFRLWNSLKTLQMEALKPFFFIPPKTKEEREAVKFTNFSDQGCVTFITTNRHCGATSQGRRFDDYWITKEQIIINITLIIIIIYAFCIFFSKT